MQFDRRQFLKCLSIMGGGLLGGLWAQGCHAAEDKQWSYTVPDWTGDTPTLMHRIRNGDIPEDIPKPSKTIDVVIVGGGLSGLTAAYTLRNENWLLLERESQLGGNAKSGEYEGITYALGSAYLVDREEPYGPLYDELGLMLRAVPNPVDMIHQQGGFAPLESAAETAADFERFKSRLTVMLDHPDFPATPFTSASAQALKLDSISFHDYLKNEVGPGLLGQINAYCYSALGGGIDTISAYAGINFYSEITGDIFAFPGGNAAVAKRLAERIGTERVQTQTATFKVQPKGDQVWVSYWQGEDLEPQTVAAKAVIMAVPYYFVPRLVADLPDDGALRSFAYDAYLVANCCFDRKFFRGGYDHWVPDSLVMTDFIDAAYAAGSGTDHTVLTIYAPFQDPRAGRMALLKGNRQEIAARLAQGLNQVLDFPRSSLREIRLTRYGHQLLTSRVGLIHTLGGIQKQVGRVILGHSDGQGMASIESAITEGLWAAQQAKAIL